MTYKSLSGGILLSDIKNFDPFVSCECGQCFRFEKISEFEYRIIANRRELFIKKADGGYFFENMTESEFNDVWRPYFDLDRDYGAIINSYSGDGHLSLAAEYGGGIRIFRQDPWETLISFIISQNNNIPRIKKIISSLCGLLGDKVADGVYAFPTAEKIYNAGIDGLAPIRAGFRAKYIVDAAEKTLSGEVSQERIAGLDYNTALCELKKIKGVGDKVANCVLLFGYGFYQAFPIDVWVKKVISGYYGEGFDPASFGEYAGIAQQYLFYYERNILAGAAS